jgi:hypothetical protein
VIPLPSWINAINDLQHKINDIFLKGRDLSIKINHSKDLGRFWYFRFGG